MTTPAQNLDTTLTTLASYHMWRPWVGTWLDFDERHNVGGSRLLRPASGTSPVRADGTRAPRDFYTYWFAGQAPTRSLEWRYSDGVIMKADNVGIFAAHSDYWLGLCGASWAKKGSPFPFPLNVENAARTRFLTELADGRAQLGATMGEFRQTVGLTRSLSEDVVKFLTSTSRAAKRPVHDLVGLLTTGSLPRVSKARKGSWPGTDIINRYLEYQFGIRPTLQDIEDSGQALSYALVEDRQKLTAIVRKGYTDRAFRTAVAVSAKDDWTVHQPVLVETSAHVSARYEIPVTATRTLNQLGLGNPASVAWELTQFSWMIDYVLGVGDWLASLTAATGTRFIEGSISRKQEVSSVGSFQVHANDGVRLQKGFHPGIARLGGGRFERTVLSTAVFPAVLPPLRSKLGLTQMANSLAALAQVARSSR